MLGKDDSWGQARAEGNCTYPSTLGPVCGIGGTGPKELQETDHLPTDPQGQGACVGLRVTLYFVKTFVF